MSDKNWVSHLLIRIVALPLAFILLYIIILGGKSDSIGLGLIYAFLALAVIGILFLGIEAISLYRKKLRNKFACNIVMLSVMLLLLLALLGGS